MSWYRWSPYVPVSARRSQAQKNMVKLRKKGLDIKPVEIEGRKITQTFWGKAWCDHLESFSDYENRLPRGRAYVRNGLVCHLDITKGEVNAMVSGTELYTVKVAIKTLPRKKWKEVKNHCAGQIGSLLELLQGSLSKNVMSVVTDRKKGLFPLPREINMQCSCPDWAVMCKHVAAVLYGVGARLDEKPELLFLLRNVDHEALISAEVAVTAAASGKKGTRRRIADDALSDVFGIELAEDVAPATVKSSPRRKKTKQESKKTLNVAMQRKAKRKAKVGAQKAQAKKQSTGVKKKSRAVLSNRSVTGKAIASLRAKFKMSQSEFARLLGVSAPSVGNWEKKTGILDLQARSLAAWNATKKLTKTQAWRKLNDSR